MLRTCPDGPGSGATSGRCRDFVGLGTDGANGKEAVGEWFGDWFRTFERDYRFEIHEARDWGDRVFIDATHHGRGRASGAPMSDRGGWVYTVRDGLIVRIDAYQDPESALEHAGPPGD